MSFKRPDGLIVWGILTGILFPVRLIAVQLLGNHWIGSFGFLTIVSLSIIYLSKKNKLGWFGRLFIQQMLRLQRKKRRFVTFGFCVFSILLLSTFLYATQNGTSDEQKIKSQITQIYKDKNKTLDLNSVLSSAKDLSSTDYIKGVYIMFYLMFFHFDIFSDIMSIMDDISGHNYSHFAMIMLVEQFEVLGILILYNRLFKNTDMYSKYSGGVYEEQDFIELQPNRESWYDLDENIERDRFIK